MENPFELLNDRLENIEKLLTMKVNNRIYSEQFNSDEGDKLLFMESAAKLLGVSKSYLYKLTSQRFIPHYKKGKKIYFKKDELLEWACTNRIATNEEIAREANRYTFKNPRKF